MSILNSKNCRLRTQTQLFYLLFCKICVKYSPCLIVIAQVVVAMAAAVCSIVSETVAHLVLTWQPQH